MKNHTSGDFAFATFSKYYYESIIGNQAQRQSETYNTDIHYDGYGDAHKHTSLFVDAPDIHNQQWHTFTFEWTEIGLFWYYDGKIVRQVDDPDLIPLGKGQFITAHS